MNVLVTGATGLLGGWLTRALAARGDRVVCLLRDAVPDSVFSRLGLDRKVVVARGDLEDYDSVARTLNEYDIEVCFHLGAQAIVGVGNRDPLSTYRSNIEGSWNILEACRRHRSLRRLVFASSDKAYGESKTLPYTEDMPLRGSQPYAVSKSCADLLAQSYLETYRLPVAIVRCGNLYGGGDTHADRIIPGTILSVLRGERPVLRSDGTPLRDYLFVQDAVGAYLALADSEEVGPFNFGTERAATALEVVRLILRLMRSKLAPVIRRAAPHEIPSQWLSCRKARERLGWRPRYSLERGLRETIAWYRRHARPRN